MRQEPDDLRKEANALRQAAAAALASGDQIHERDLLKRAVWCERHARELEAGVSNPNLFVGETP